MECKLIKHYPIQNADGKTTSDVMIGEVVAWHFRKEVFSEKDHKIDIVFFFFFLFVFFPQVFVFYLYLFI
jgi:hypothetical protein